MIAPVDAAPIQLVRSEWFRQVGDVAGSIGTDRFHVKLVELFGSTIPHCASWIIRYSRVAPPDVIYTSNVPQEVIDFYLARCSPLDPFSAHWKRHEAPGVRTLASFSRTQADVDPQPYNRLFKSAANIEDELGIFFSTVGHSSLGMFLEREKGRFTTAEINRAQLVFPVLDGFHKAHIGRIFERLRFAGDANESELVSRPTLVLDRFGQEIFATPSWREALAADASIAETVRTVGEQRSVQLDRHNLKIERFDEYFPLAPSGSILVLVPRSKGPGEANWDQETSDGPASAKLDIALTAREGEVFDYMMAGKTTGWIAQKLEISKGTVKNYRLRIYRKADVTSERELFQKLSRAKGAP